jgi:hypothetical protein
LTQADLSVLLSAFTGGSHLNCTAVLFAPPKPRATEPACHPYATSPRSSRAVATLPPVVSVIDCSHLPIPPALPEHLPVGKKLRPVAKGMSGLRPADETFGRGCFRDAGVRAGTLQGDPARSNETGLYPLRSHRASRRTKSADRTWDSRPWTSRSCAGFKAVRSSAAVSAIGDLCASWSTIRSLHDLLGATGFEFSQPPQFQLRNQPVQLLRRAAAPGVQPVTLQPPSSVRRSEQPSVPARSNVCGPPSAPEI